jgi:hypothetical protein
MRKILLLITVLLIIPLQIIVAQAPKIIGYQYWFDDNDAEMVSQSVGPATTLDLNTSVNVPAFPVGFHRFNIRFQDDSLRFSPVSSSLFFFPVSTLINGYEYWFNDDYAGKIAVVVSNTTLLDLSSAISASMLNTGMNTFHIRFRDVSGNYSSTSTAYFVIIPEMLISGYEYWFDNDYGSKTTMNVANTQMLDLSETITATSLSLGFHSFHIRFRNNTGVWCSTQSDLFYKHGNGNLNNLISYEYWFDDNPAERVSVPLENQPTADLVTTVDASALPPGLHRAHLRFQSGDQPSVVSSGYFYKSGTANIAENAISGYRFWFDNDPSNMRVISLAQPAGDVILLDSLELPYLPLGKHLMSLDFIDTVGNYSTVVSDSVDVQNCLPYPAKAITGNTQVCKGTSGVVYSIPAITNATGYSWNLPEGATLVSGANTRTITVDYALNAATGLITVSGTNPCGTGVEHSLPVNLNPLPTPTISGDTAVCSGATGIIYTADPGYSGYTWSVTPGGSVVSGIGTNQITIDWTTTPGQETISGGYTNSFGCYDTKEMHVSVKPAPPSTRTLAGIVVPGGQTLCADATDTLIVPENGNILQVQEGGTAILMAGKIIRILPGTTGASGSYIHAYISSDCFYCLAIPHTLPQAFKEEPIAGITDQEALSTSDGSFFKVYPNPTTGNFTVESNSVENLSGTIEIFGIHGEMLISEQLPDRKKHEFSLSGRPDGIYVVRVISVSVSGISRVIKY